MRNERWAVGVVVPACNEEQGIGTGIDAILTSLEACASVALSWIVVVADSCQDRTAERARARLGKRGEVIAIDASSPGTARRLGADKVLQQFAALDSADIWIANTDADSAPHSDWITQQLALADQGYCGVAGVVHVASIDCRLLDVIRRWRKEYWGALTPGIAHGLDVNAVWAGRTAAGVDHVVDSYAADIAHPHVHGANLGFRADAYLDAGGWSDLALAEDHCLWSRVRSQGWRVASSIACVVTTSGRLKGRAEGGFADSLRKMAGPYA